MSRPDPLPTVSRKQRSNKNRAVDAAVEFIKSRRQGPGNNQGRIPRVAIENAARAQTGLNQTEIDAAFVEAYDDMVALGLVPPRA